MTTTTEVTQADAISFLESAVRNWKFVPNLSTDDVQDVADALSRFAAKHRAQALAQGRLEGVEAGLGAAANATYGNVYADDCFVAIRAIDPTTIANQIGEK